MSTALLAPGARLERVATGTIWAEGPVWLADRRVVRYSDIPNNRIVEFSEDTGEFSVYANQAEYPNGRTLDLDGSIIQCSHGRRAVERELDGQIIPIVNAWRGRRLNSPNDVVVKSDGTIWFTDPSYGIERPGEGHRGDLEYGDRYVFRYDPATAQLDPVVIDIEQPNGLAFSPDEKILYVADSSIAPASEADPERPGGCSIHAYDIFSGRHAKNGRTFATITPGLPDGFRIDVAGNIWSSSFDSVQVFSPEGVLLERIGVPEKIANLCFGGRDGSTLYIAATSSLYRIQTATTDAAARWIQARR
ncbi:MAG: SMP-30/gluconolactonase/LRE family protein [Verrucomicrobia bacterium]|nr:SMP-30/gluconolactonase/LRE family protein [Verrucomicrobiota bacterium]